MKGPRSFAFSTFSKLRQLKNTHHHRLETEAVENQIANPRPRGYTSPLWSYGGSITLDAEDGQPCPTAQIINME